MENDSTKFTQQSSNLRFAVHNGISQLKTCIWRIVSKGFYFGFRKFIEKLLKKLKLTLW